MRAPNLGTVFFAPQDPSNIRDAEGLARYIRDMELRISSAITALAAGHIDMVHVAPLKPRDGDIRYADGSYWNPGAGKGIYAYNGTAWVKMVSL